MHPRHDESDPLLRGLNDQQIAAVMTSGSPLIVASGPGSGKTSVLTRRVARHVREGVRPDQLLAWTFTKKASRELRERLGRLIGEDRAKKISTGTFHSLCASWLRRDIHVLGRRRDFSIYDADDSERVVSAIYRERDWETKGGKVGASASRIGRWKNDGLRPVQVEQRGLVIGDFLAERDLEIYAEYERRLHRANALDFDDLLLCMQEVLAADERLLTRYQSQWVEVLADECQDDNPVQNWLLEALIRRHRGLFVIGDSQQSIYRFRGAMPGALAALHAKLPDARLLYLGQNYRSTPEIVNLAQCLIEHAPERDKKYTTNIWTTNTPGKRVQVVEAMDGDTEAERIARTIVEHIRRGGKAQDWAIIYRVHALSRPIEQALLRARVPYQIVGGVGFYERAEVKTVLAYLRLLRNPLDEAAFARAANIPGRGFGDTSIEKVLAAAKASDRPAMEVLGDLAGPLGSSLVKLTGRSRAGALAFWEVMTWLQAEAQKLGIVDLLAALLDHIEFKTYLGEAHGAEEAEDRWLNVQALVAAAAPFAEQPIPDQLGAFLDDIALFSTLDAPGGGDTGVELMTSHASKGREFPYVWIPAVEETIFPWRRAEDDEEIDEERRLLFVAMTRAMKELYMSYVYRRRIYRDAEPMTVSRFLLALPEEHFDVI